MVVPSRGRLARSSAPPMPIAGTQSRPQQRFLPGEQVTLPLSEIGRLRVLGFLVDPNAIALAGGPQAVRDISESYKRLLLGSRQTLVSPEQRPQRTAHHGVAIAAQVLFVHRFFV
jgi:hypothetical protein